MPETIAWKSDNILGNFYAEMLKILKGLHIFTHHLNICDPIYCRLMSLLTIYLDTARLSWKT